jgi:hypothetical protein
VIENHVTWSCDLVVFTERTRRDYYGHCKEEEISTTGDSVCRWFSRCMGTENAASSTS